MKKTPKARKVVTATPQTKSATKQVTKPENMVDLRQSKSELDTEQKASNGSKKVSGKDTSKETKVAAKNKPTS